MKDILLDLITSKYSRTISTGDSRGGTFSMTINGRFFQILDGMTAQENGQEKFADVYTLYPGLATNLHLALIRSVFQNNEE